MGSRLVRLFCRRCRRKRREWLTDVTRLR